MSSIHVDDSPLSGIVRQASGQLLRWLYLLPRQRRASAVSAIEGRISSRSWPGACLTPGS
jgi:hypothetical protein